MNLTLTWSVATQSEVEGSATIRLLIEENQTLKLGLVSYHFRLNCYVKTDRSSKHLNISAP